MKLFRYTGLMCALALTVLASTAYAQQAGYSVAFTDTTITAGDAIQIAWEAPAGSRSRDWVGLYRPGSSDRNFLEWEYIPNTGREGTVSLSYDEPGTYEVRLFTDDRFEQAAVSEASVVIESGSPDAGGYSVAFTDTTITAGDAIQIAWEAPAGSRSRDWIGLYRTSAGDRSFVDWKYIANSGQSGTITLSHDDPGTYEARLFTSNGYTRAAVTPQTVTLREDDDEEEPNEPDPDPDDGSYSLTVTPLAPTVGQTITVTYQAPSGVSRTRDWVGLYRTTDGDRAYISWKYIGSGASGALTFTAPAVGSYEFRYFKNNSYRKEATSPTLTVSGGGGEGGQCTVANLNSITNYPPENGPVIAFGDSLTAGVGASTDQDYVSQLERKAGINIINEGVSGDTTEEALSRLQSDVLARNPSVVIVWLGGNDIISRFYERAQDGLEDISTTDWLRLLALRITGKIPEPAGITEAETFANITEIIERIQATGAITIVVGFSGGIFDENLEARYEAVAENTGSLYVPDVLDDVLGRPSRMSDLVHPNNTGYGIVADRALPYLACVVPD